MALQEVKPDGSEECSQFFVKQVEKEWLSAKEAAAYLGVSVGSLRNMVSARLVTFYKLRRRLRFRTSDLRQMLLATKQGA